MNKSEKNHIIDKCVSVINDTNLSNINYTKTSKPNTWNSERSIISLTNLYNIEENVVIDDNSYISDHPRININLLEKEKKYYLTVALDDVILFDFKISKSDTKRLIDAADVKYEERKEELISKVFTSYNREKNINEVIN